MEPAFALRSLTKTYGEGPTAVRALAGIDLEITEGELLILLGPSGSGKSTMLNILGGLDRPSLGEVRFRDRALTDMSERTLTAFAAAMSGSSSNSTISSQA